VDDFLFARVSLSKKGKDEVKATLGGNPKTLWRN